MFNDFSESDDWRTETNYRRWRRADVVTLYSESRKWKRRFWMALFLDVILSILVLILAGSR